MPKQSLKLSWRELVVLLTAAVDRTQVKREAYLAQLENTRKAVCAAITQRMEESGRRVFLRVLPKTLLDSTCAKLDLREFEIFFNSMSPAVSGVTMRVRSVADGWLKLEDLKPEHQLIVLKELCRKL